MNSLFVNTIDYGLVIMLVSLIASTSVIGGAMLVTRWMRVENAARLSAIYRSVLLATVATPIIAAILLAADLGGPVWQIGSLAQSESRSDLSQFQLFPRSIRMEARSIEVEALSGEAKEGSEPRQDPALSMASVTESLTKRETGTTEVSKESSIWNVIKATTCFVWILIAGFLFLRLALNFRSLRRALRRAVPVDEGLQDQCDEVANRIGTSRAMVVHSPYFASPFLAGICEPVIHLPTEILLGHENPGTSIDTSSVFAHELAHWKRRDNWFCLLGQVGLALLFYQPLLKRLVNRIEQVADEVCDDHALALGASPAQYATCLVKLAGGQLSTPVLSMSIVSEPSLLSRRVNRIVDSGRKLTTTVRQSFATSAFLGSAFLAITFALLTTPQRVIEAQPPGLFGEESTDADLAEQLGGQLVKIFRVRVVDEEGKPIRGVRVTPRALGSSQGHGRWLDNGKDGSEMVPISTTTNDQGLASVEYPFYCTVAEKTKTLQVSLRLEHEAYISAFQLHVDVPLSEAEPIKELTMQNAAVAVFEAYIDGDAVPPEELLLMASGTMQLGKPTNSGRISIGPCQPKVTEFFIVRIIEGQPTHFSQSLSLDLKAGESDVLRVDLQPAASIAGQVDSSVPRPIKNGRLSLMTLPSSLAQGVPFFWMTHTQIDSDGSFEIPAWPANQSIQVIGLSDGYRVVDGDPPIEVADPQLQKEYPLGRPQIFRPPYNRPVSLPMEPLVPVKVQVFDLENHPVANASVSTNPNVGWWNTGSQIYCEPLVDFADLKSFDSSLDFFNESRSQSSGTSPFRAKTDDDGSVLLRLPEGSNSCSAYSDDLCLPVFLGRRSVKVEVRQGDFSDVVLRLVPKGDDFIGDYDKLAGVVFGCSTKEGRSICALPEVREKMDEFAYRIHRAEDPQDPEVLIPAYEVVAEAFEAAGDRSESRKWRQRAEKLRSKLKQY
ncbi:MAG: M56 family metallopeptidase [Planctomycetota bacterium]